MAHSEIRLEGVEEIVEHFDNLVDIEKMRKVMGRACELVAGAAVEKAPKGNGDLQQNIKTKVDIDGDNVIGTVFTPIEYAPYVEYGTGLFAEVQGRQDVPWSYQDEKGEWHSTYGMHPQPFMRPALNENRERVKEKLREGITK